MGILTNRGPSALAWVQALPHLSPPDPEASCYFCGTVNNHILPITTTIHLIASNDISCRYQLCFTCGSKIHHLSAIFVAMATDSSWAFPRRLWGKRRLEGTKFRWIDHPLCRWSSCAKKYQRCMGCNVQCYAKLWLCVLTSFFFFGILFFDEFSWLIPQIFPVLCQRVQET